MPAGPRSFTRGGKEKPGNPAAMGKKVKSTLVLIILKKYFCVFSLMFCEEIIIGLFAWFCFILSTGDPHEGGCGGFRFCSEPVVVSHCGFPGSCAGTGLHTPSKLCRCELRLKLIGFLCFER